MYKNNIKTRGFKSREDVELEQRLSVYLDLLLHRRFENIDKIEQELCLQHKVFKVTLKEEPTTDKVCDDFLIGTLETIDSRLFDVQVYFIKDNLGNYYITETELLGEYM